MEEKYIFQRHSQRPRALLKYSVGKPDSTLVNKEGRNAGALRVAQRRDDYIDRRTDGYSEPLEVYVLGTSHVSEASAADVRRVVDAVQPQSVVVELCKSRAGLMMPVADDADVANPLAMSGDGFASTLARSIRLGGQSTALLRAALAWAAQGSLGDEADGEKPAAAMYGDFRAAKEGAEEMEAQIVLGDRPVEVTLQRAWEALSLGERLDLGRILLGLAFSRAGMGGMGGGVGEGGTNAAEELLRKRVSTGEVEDDALEALIAMLGERFPSVVGPLIFERDLYLAWTLKRSRAVCGQRRVVGVVGRGHLAGVMRAIEADRGGDTLVFKELTGNRGGGSGGGGSAERSNLDRGRGLAKFAARIAAETVAGYALWELYKTVTAA
eukprot:jgi/Undpi1/9747/HiC_scaffold_27.g12203.m1